MIRDSKGKVRLTRSELNKLRQENAKNGFVIGDIKTEEEFHHAAIRGLPTHIVDDMLEFFETGSSPLTRKGNSERGLVQKSGSRQDTD